MIDVIINKNNTTVMVVFKCSFLATRKDLIYLKTLQVFLDFYKSCIDDYSVWPNYLYMLVFHIFSFFKTRLILRLSANTCKVPKENPPFENCAYITTLT